MAQVALRGVYAVGDTSLASIKHALAFDLMILRSVLEQWQPVFSADDRLVWKDYFPDLVKELHHYGHHHHNRFSHMLDLEANELVALVDEMWENYGKVARYPQRMFDLSLVEVVGGMTVSARLTPDLADALARLEILFRYDAQTLWDQIVKLCPPPASGPQVSFLGGLKEGRVALVERLELEPACELLIRAGLFPQHVPVMEVGRWMLILKRAFDAVAASLILLLCSPIFLALMAVMLTEKGPIFYSQRRIGHKGKIFRCHKFRSMVPNSDKVLADLLQSDPAAREEWERTVKLRNDPRITRIGHFMRKTSMDELPQLWNVVKGDMSLVGPRPIAWHEREKWGPYYRHYCMVPPGITGSWQIYHRSAEENYHTRITSLLSYCQDWSLWRDIKLLVLTLKVPFSGAGV